MFVARNDSVNHPTVFLSLLPPPGYSSYLSVQKEGARFIDISLVLYVRDSLSLIALEGILNGL